MSNKTLITKAKIVLLVIFLILGLTIYRFQKPQLVQENQFVLGTFGQIHLYTKSPKSGNKAINQAYQRIREIENSMSIIISDSDIYQLNENAGIKPIKVTQDTLNVIHKGLEYYELTKGAFNIGLGKISKLWGVNIETDNKIPPAIPKEEEILDAKKHIDLYQLEINNNELFIKDPKMSIDLGGIAKGYAVDEAVRTLEGLGIKSGFVNLGGDIFVLGSKPDGTAWQMGIQSPELGSSNVIVKIQLRNSSIVTSGDYQRYIEKDNKRYHHIIDPSTGYPAENELTSVTIISDTTIKGDSYSTAAFVMGLEKGLDFIENLENTEAIFLTKDKRIYASSGIRDEIELMDKEYKLFK